MKRASIPLPVLLLGFGGLLPSAALAGLSFVDNPATHSIAFWGVVYGMLILTFLGGAWWAMASRWAPNRLPVGVLIVSVLPSLLSFALLIMLFSFAALSPAIAGGIVGGAILLSPLVDRWIAARGHAPDWWMALRVPLSIGLGLLTIACGLLA